MEATRPHRRPTFKGNREDLRQFMLLLESRIRSDERERALHEWETYKLGRQAAFIRRQKVGRGGKRGVWMKGDYMRSVTAPAIDLRGGTFVGVCLGYADLRGVRFDRAEFVLDHRGWFAMKGAKLVRASLRYVRMPGARLMEADLRNADLTGADLTGADLREANLDGAVLHGTKLRGANLELASLVGAQLEGADLSGSRVYGVSAWDVRVDENDNLRRDLVVTPSSQPNVTVDNIEVAQFVYLLLTNPKIRGVIDTVCRKGVLILGRFSAERKAVLDALRDELRRRDFVPIIFDFQKPTERDITETVKTLAGLCRFIIADITNPRSNPLELQATVPDYMVPMVPIIAEGEEPFALFKDLRNKYHWVLDPLEYPSADRLISVIEASIIKPALAKHAEMLAARAQAIRTRRVADYEGE